MRQRRLPVPQFLLMVEIQRDVCLWPRLCKKSLDFARNGTATHICNEWSASKTSGPTLITCQSKCRSHLPPLLEILRFYTGSARSGRRGLIAAINYLRRAMDRSLASHWRQAVGQASLGQNLEQRPKRAPEHYPTLGDRGKMLDNRTAHSMI
jgi:hypothetical protein